MIKLYTIFINKQRGKMNYYINIYSDSCGTNYAELDTDSLFYERDEAVNALASHRAWYRKENYKYTIVSKNNELAKTSLLDEAEIVWLKEYASKHEQEAYEESKDSYLDI